MLVGLTDRLPLAVTLAVVSRPAGPKMVAGVMCLPAMQ